jgi:hypothetical protein
LNLVPAKSAWSPLVKIRFSFEARHGESIVKRNAEILHNQEALA